MGFAAGGHIDLAVPVVEDFDGLAGRGPETEEADPFSRLDAGDTQATESDDTGTQERSDVGVVEGGWKGEGKVGTDQGVLCVAPVDGVAGEDGIVAEILFAAAAEGAGAVGAADPGDADAHPRGAVSGRTCDDLADNLMAGDEGPVDEGEIAFEDMEIGAAYSAGEDTEEEMAFGQDGAGNVFDLKGLIGGVEDGCFHTGPPGRSFV
jgi:hypothetical protein